MNRTLLIKGITVAMLASFLATAAGAADGQKWKARVGLTNIDPKSNNGVVAAGALPAEPTGLATDVQDDTFVTFNGVYMIDENWGVELLAALPFEHDVEAFGSNLGSLGEIGSTKHLPPTLSAQYYFNNTSSFTPYVGLGLNYTLFFNEKLTSTAAGLLSGQLGITVNDFSLDNSLGLAYQIGVDYDINEKWLVNLDLRKIDIDADAEVNGIDIGTVKIDPTLIGVNVGYKF